MLLARFRRRRFDVMPALLSLTLAFGALASAPAPVQARPADDAKANTEVFDEVWKIARDKFFDEKLMNLDWEAVGDKHRPTYAAAKTDAERSAAINAML